MTRTSTLDPIAARLAELRNTIAQDTTAVVFTALNDGRTELRTGDSVAYADRQGNILNAEGLSGKLAEIMNKCADACTGGCCDKALEITGKELSPDILRERGAGLVSIGAARQDPVFRDGGGAERVAQALAARAAEPERGVGGVRSSESQQSELQKTTSERQPSAIPESRISQRSVAVTSERSPDRFVEAAPNWRRREDELVLVRESSRELPVAVRVGTVRVGTVQVGAGASFTAPSSTGPSPSNSPASSSNSPALALTTRAPSSVSQNQPQSGQSRVSSQRASPSVAVAGSKVSSSGIISSRVLASRTISARATTPRITRGVVAISSALRTQLRGLRTRLAAVPRIRVRVSIALRQRQRAMLRAGRTNAQSRAASRRLALRRGATVGTRIVRRQQLSRRLSTSRARLAVVSPRRARVTRQMVARRAKIIQKVGLIRKGGGLRRDTATRDARIRAATSKRGAATQLIQRSRSRALNLSHRRSARSQLLRGRSVQRRREQDRENAQLLRTVQELTQMVGELREEVAQLRGARVLGGSLRSNLQRGKQRRAPLRAAAEERRLRRARQKQRGEAPKQGLVIGGAGGKLAAKAGGLSSPSTQKSVFSAPPTHLRTDMVKDGKRRVRPGWEEEG